jgi:hypothetical protein
MRLQMDDKPPKPMWGPWSPSASKDPAERIAQLRCLRTLVHVFAGSRKAPDYTDTVKYLEIELRRAEGDEDAAEFALHSARAMFDALPAARQRDIIATFAVLHKPLAPEREE